MNGVLSCEQHRVADMAAARLGVSFSQLMENAGAHVAAVAQRLWAPRPTLVVCGPGGNGGDGYVAAHHLRAAGWPVRVAVLAPPKGEAVLSAAAAWGAETAAPQPDALAGAELVIDAMFGAGLTRPIEGEAAALIGALPETVLSVDAPSGVDGDTGRAAGPHVRALATATFLRLKPAHLLEPGRTLCGRLGVFLADIGHPAEAAAEAANQDAPLFHNAPGLWRASFPWPPVASHKHARGRLGVLTGGFADTGAARLAARAGLRIGAGLATLLAPEEALSAVAGAASMAVMTRAIADTAEFGVALSETDAAVLGPAAGVHGGTRGFVVKALDGEAALALDADALTVFQDAPERLFERVRARAAPVVMTPHPGEFRRLFPDLDLQDLDKIAATAMAAQRSGAVVLLKGADTVIAAPDGRACVNTHASPYLATAGSGDVLVGMIGGLLAQGMTAFDAAAAGAWLHGECGLALGPGVIAEDLVDAIPRAVLALRRGRR